MTRSPKVLIRGIGNINRIRNKNELLSKKNSDTLIIYGSGYSISDLSSKERKNLSVYDSVGFNWFLFSKINTTYYLVREQANIPKRVHKNETQENFISLLNEFYRESCLIIQDIEHHSPKAINYAAHTGMFMGEGIVVKDIKLKKNHDGVEDFKSTDILEKGIIHGKCTLNNILHFAVFMGYETIVFVGIDLYDSRYFWLKYDETRHTVSSKNKRYKNKHAVYSSTINLIKKVNKTYSKISMFTYNPKSMLAKVMKVWSK